MGWALVLIVIGTVAVFNTIFGSAASGGGSGSFAVVLIGLGFMAAGGFILYRKFRGNRIQ